MTNFEFFYKVIEKFVKNIENLEKVALNDGVKPGIFLKILKN